MKGKFRSYTADNKQAVLDRNKAYQATPEYKARRAKLELERQQLDTLYTFKCRIRKMIGAAMARKSTLKSSKTHEILGCSYDHLRQHLEITWESNYPGQELDWKLVHIDHIKPLASATTEQEVVKLNHYTNLQLLTATDNLVKGCKY